MVSEFQTPGHGRWCIGFAPILTPIGEGSNEHSRAYRIEPPAIPWWEAIHLFGLGFVEYAAGNHAEADRAFTRMHARFLLAPTRLPSSHG